MLLVLNQIVKYCGTKRLVIKAEEISSIEIEDDGTTLILTEKRIFHVKETLREIIKVIKNEGYNIKEIVKRRI